MTVFKMFFSTSTYGRVRGLRAPRRSKRRESPPRDVSGRPAGRKESLFLFCFFFLQPLGAPKDTLHARRQVADTVFLHRSVRLLLLS